MKQKYFLILFLILSLSASILVAFYNFRADPYWVFHTKRLWESYYGFETKQHFSKGLQVVTRQADTLFIGSSRVYRAFNTEDQSFYKDAYNCGIPGMTIYEAEKYIDQAIHFTSPKKIILGLDLWMFDKKHLYKSPAVKNLGKLSNLVDSFFTALLSKDALFDSIQIKKSGPIPSPHGRWDGSGCYMSISIPKERIDVLLGEYKKFFDGVEIDFTQTYILQKIIDKIKNKKIKLYLYISPIHSKILEIYNNKKHGLFDEFRKSISNLCIKNNVVFIDYSQNYLNALDLEKGSTDVWFDYSHFLPPIGENIFKDLMSVSKMNTKNTNFLKK
jgi:hypothetical protein